ncbi:MAG: WbqC family protein [Longicatena sp.]
MIVSMHQPHYFPWFGQINKIASSDVFVILDNVQFSRGGKMNRQKFLCLNHEPKYITIPYKKKGFMEIPFKNLEIASPDDWQLKHANFIINNYSKYPYFDEVWSNIEFIFKKKYKTVCEVSCDSTLVILKMLGINTRVIFQSDIENGDNYKNNEMIINIMKKLNMDIYLSGNGAKKYMDLNEYKEHDISVFYQIFKYPEYTKKIDHNITDISIMDILFNVGIMETKKLVFQSVTESTLNYHE